MLQQSKLQVQLTKEEFATSDPTMHYQPTNEAEEALKEESLQKTGLKFHQVRNQLKTFPVNQAVWLIFMYQCMWAVLHLSKDDEAMYFECIWYLNGVRTS